MRAQPGTFVRAPASTRNVGQPTSAPRRSVRQAAARFAGDERGVTAVIFSIVFAVLFFVVALAIDYTAATQEQARQQSAVDAAALAASHYLGLENQDVDGPDAAQKFFKENMGPGSTAEIAVALDGEAGTIAAVADNKYLTKLLKAVLPVNMRRETLDVGAASTVVKGDRIEVAFALDNSTSMAGRKIEALRQATHDAIGILFAGAKRDGDVMIGLVPFAASVNVGAANAAANWIYKGPESNLRYPVFADGGSKSRFDILAELAGNRTWGGCVEARPAPYDSNDTIPDADDTDTMFVPMFAPDEPSDYNAEAAGYEDDDYPNNYLNDFGGTCPTPEQVCISWRTRNGVKSCREYGPKPLPVVEAQARSCKYKNASVGSSEGPAVGPNQSCTTPAILPLTSSRSTLETKVNALVANGYTNVAEGAAWAWRVLSPTAPFVEGRSYGDRSNKKIMIVMTDGDNRVLAAPQHNKSVYAAYGYGSQDRLGATYTEAGYMYGVNDKTLAACSNAKDAGVTVFTVAFGTEITATGLSLLRDCASSPGHAFIASNEVALVNTFQNIARKISKLRVAM